jgi:hypothetical protein
MTNQKVPVIGWSLPTKRPSCGTSTTEIEVVPAGDLRLRALVDGHLARDAIELAGAAEHHHVTVTGLDIAPDPDVADAADLSVQANERVALKPVVRLFPALKAVAADLVAAVLRVKELVLEDKRVLAHLVKRMTLREHPEVTVERERRGCEHGGAERGYADHNRKSLPHARLPLPRVRAPRRESPNSDNETPRPYTRSGGSQGW